MIELRLLLEPALAARTEISDEGLADLADSIRELGVIQPLTVLPRDGGLFEVVAGHRRMIASRQAGLLSVPCIVLADETHAAAVKIHENVVREELHPLDEAINYSHLYGECGEDIEHVAELVRRPVSHVGDRLLLLKGDERVIKALRVNLISLGVATELNKMELPADVGWYLEHAIRGGCSIPQMRQWRKEANARAEMARLAPPPEGATAPPSGPNGSDGAAPATYLGYARPHELSSSREIRDCFFCRQPGEEWQGIRLFVCRPCADTTLSKLEEQDLAHGQRRR
jgi:ParB family chromosome partitioning protein